MSTILIIIATYLVAKYGTFNTTQLKNDINYMKDKCGKTTEERS